MRFHFTLLSRGGLLPFFYGGKSYARVASIRPPLSQVYSVLGKAQPAGISIGRLIVASLLDAHITPFPVRCVVSSAVMKFFLAGKGKGTGRSYMLAADDARHMNVFVFFLRFGCGKEQK